ncbi:MAG: hypothetical protein GF311_05775 [Candidatus Lokiarchaeota archaeon]|nr:hypothetical protein [Candidatus Lokiarchaeota archaeon]
MNESFKSLYQSKELNEDFRNKMFIKLLKFPEIKEIYSREDEIFDALLSGNLSSVNLAPIVRLTSSYLAFDIIYSGILKIKKKILAPNILGFDYFHMKPFNFTMK